MEGWLRLNLMGLVSKASATRILIASPIALTFDGELDWTNDDGGGGDDRSWYRQPDLLGQIALYGLRIRGRLGGEGGGTGLPILANPAPRWGVARSLAIQPYPPDPNQWRRGELLD